METKIQILPRVRPKGATPEATHHNGNIGSEKSSLLQKKVALNIIVLE
jgi:hypothetical protein